MATIEDWKTDAFLTSKDNDDISYDLVIYGIGLMNDKTADLAYKMLRYYKSKIESESNPPKIAVSITQLTSAEFLSYPLGKQKNVTDCLGTKYSEDSDTLCRIFEERSYFIHRFRYEYMKDKGILPEKVGKLKSLLVSINHYIEKVDKCIRESGPSKKPKKETVKKPKRKLVVEKDVLKDFINNCIQEKGIPDDGSPSCGPGQCTRCRSGEKMVDISTLANIVNKQFPGLNYGYYTGGINKFADMAKSLGFDLC